MTLQERLYQAAQDYVGLGWGIIPLHPNSKLPVISNWPQDYIKDVAQIDKFWGRAPCNIGIVTGRASGLVVLDVDVKHGAKGLESLARLQREYGALNTRRIQTPTGGLHFYFAYPPNTEIIKNKVGFLPGLDIRADGGYVVAPPSIVKEI